MNEHSDRYVATTLDELYLGGPDDDLAERILARSSEEHEVRTLPDSGGDTRRRWYWLQAACVALVLGLIGVLLLPQRDPEGPAQSTATADTEQVEDAEGPRERVERLEREVKDARWKLKKLERELEEARKDLAEPAGEVEPDREDKADGRANEPIEIDLVRKDLHTVMSHIGAQGGLNISIDGDIKLDPMTVMYKDVKPREAIRAICKAHNLECIEDGTFIIIKNKPDDETEVGDGEE